jgi:hypothetical protein
VEDNSDNNIDEQGGGSERNAISGTEIEYWERRCCEEQWTRNKTQGFEVNGKTKGKGSLSPSFIPS